MTIGFRVNSGAFAKNSWHFRNALVRENYNDLEDGVHITAKVFKMFFSNFILGMELLKNQYVYVDGNSQSVSHRVPKSQFDTLVLTERCKNTREPLKTLGKSRVTWYNVCKQIRKF